MQEQTAVRETSGPQQNQRSSGSRLLIPAMLVFIAVLFLVSFIGMLTVMPPDHDPIHLTKLMIAWAVPGMFASVLVYPVGLIAMMRTHQT